MRKRLQSPPHHFRNRRSPTDGENIVSDWLIKFQKKSACQSKISAPFHKSVKTKQSGRSQESVFKTFGSFLAQQLKFSGDLK